jgi:hypothetical protein
VAIVHRAKTQQSKCNPYISAPSARACALHGLRTGSNPLKSQSKKLLDLFGAPRACASASGHTREPPGRVSNGLAVYAVIEIEKIARSVTFGVGSYPKHLPTVACARKKHSISDMPEGGNTKVRR